MNDEKYTKRKVVPFIFNRQNLSSLPNIVVSLLESKERIEQLKEFVHEVMIKGVDYGLVDGFSKPTLLKPGAEKLCDVFGFSKTVEVVNRIEHWETGIFAYEVKMTLTRKENSVFEAEGLGSCNSKEASFHDQDPFTIVNTILKMAKKRALIDAVLSATRASGLFTQDIEDFPNKVGNKRSNDKVSKQQLQTIFQIISEVKIHHETAKEMMRSTYHVEHSTQLTKKQASDFIRELLLLKQAFQEVKDIDISK